MIWESTLRMIAERPVLGYGLGTFVMEYPRFRLPEYFQRSRATNVTDHAHNEFLEIAAEQGLLGLAATVWLWGFAFYNGLRSLPSSGEERRWGLGILGATTVLLVHGMLDVGLRYPPNQTLLWLLLGLMAGGSGPAVRRLGSSGVPAGHSRMMAWLRSPIARTILATLCLVGSVWVTIAGIVRPVMADVCERRARMAADIGQLGDAAADARRSLEFQPFRPTVRYLLAGVLPPEQAIQECLKIEELSPDYADVTYNLGKLYLRQKQPEEALLYLTRAVQSNPYDAGRRVAIASAYAQLGQIGLARTNLEDALRLDPRNPDARGLLTEFDEKKLP